MWRVLVWWRVEILILTFEFCGLWNLKLGSNLEVILNFSGGCWGFGSFKSWSDIGIWMVEFEVLMLDFKMGLSWPSVGLNWWRVEIWNSKFEFGFEWDCWFDLWISDFGSSSPEVWSDIWIWMVEFEVLKLDFKMRLSWECWFELMASWNLNSKFEFGFEWDCWFDLWISDFGSSSPEVWSDIWIWMVEFWSFEVLKLIL